MASVADMTERFEREGIFPASSSLTVRRMRDDDPSLLPEKRKGTSLNAPQVNPCAITNFILGHGAHLPIGAANAVHTLRGLVGTSYETLKGTASIAPFKTAVGIFNDLIGVSLGEFLDNQIAGVGDPQIRAGMKEVVGHDWTLSLCVEGKFATITQHVDDELWVMTFGDREVSDRVRRTVAMPYRVILIAGELWQDSCERLSGTQRLIPN